MDRRNAFFHVFDLFGSWGVDRDSFAFEGGEVVRVPRFEIADLEGERVVVSAG